MEISELKIRHVRFPGRAGELQRQGATPALVRELGDNYASYHAFLARALQDLGARPEEAQMLEDIDAYFAAWDRIDDVVVAEVVLRRCRAHRQAGASLADAPSRSVPLVDERDRLISVETQAPERDLPGHPVQRSVPQGQVPPIAH
jgi:hypothetical protein